MKTVITSFIVSLCILTHAQGVMQVPASPDHGVRFIENKGQWPEQVLFKAELRTGAIFLERDRFTFNLYHPKDFDALYGHHGHGHVESHEIPEVMRWHAYSMIFENATQCEVTGDEPYGDYSNYFIGNDPSKWASGAKAFARVDYHNIYPGITLSIYSKDGKLKYDWILSSSADPKKIKVRYEGVDELHVVNDNLHVITSVNSVIEHAPVSWRMDRNGTSKLASAYSVQGNTVTLSFPSGYRPGYAGAVIDPILSFSTYTGSTADNFGFTACPDNTGLAIAGGLVFNTGYPLTSGAYQSNFAGTSDVGITKFNEDGSQLIFSTYLGGSSCETPNSTVVNNKNEVLILGVTGSSDFPTTIGCYDATFNGGTSVSLTSNGTVFTSGTDIYLSKLSPDGTALLASTFMGGTANDGLNVSGTLPYNYGDQFRGDVIVDASDNIFFTSSTLSTDFPTTPGSYQPASTGGQDAVVAKFNPNLTGLLWSTYLGGGAADAGYSIKLSQSGSVYVAGGTTSGNFPSTPGTLNSSPLGGTADGYIVRLNASGSTLEAGTFLGTSSYDQAYFIDLDPNGEVYVTGQTSGNYPTTPSVYINPNSGQFVSALDPDLTTLLISTVFGKGDGNPELSPTAFLVDACRNVYVSGWGGETNAAAPNPDLNIFGMPVDSNSHQDSTFGSDFYFIVFQPDLVAREYSTYFGGPQGAEHVDGGTCRFDKAGVVYHAVCASCGGFSTDFPTTPGAWSATNNSSNCNLAVFKFEFQLPIAHAIAVANPSTRGCAPYTVNFDNLGSSGVTYFFDFGDGNTGSSLNPVHTYPNAGQYQVMFVATDTSPTCVSWDTAYLTIEVVDAPVLSAAGAPDPPNGCVPLDVQFINNSSDPGFPFSWHFGDGGTSSDFAPIHVFTSSGMFDVRLVMVDTGVCEAHDTAFTAVEVYPRAEADFGFDPLVALENEPLIFQNSSTNDIAWHWDFGDGTTSTLRDPTHTYDQAGIYEICMTAFSDHSCNDFVCKTVQVYEPRELFIPTAFTPNNDGVNDHYFHYAKGYTSANLRIFNRWGLLVFETDDLNVGWDGKWNGVDQDIAAFAYILTITFAITGETEVHTGNVTLLR